MTKKLLLIGIDTATPYIVKYAKTIDIYTIITDGRDPQDSPLKLVADEYWMFDITELDHIEAKCRETGVTAVMAGNHETCLDMAKELCARLGLPFYASDKSWNIVRNKFLFKEACLEAGLEIPKTYQAYQSLNEIDLKQINYPVMVKPSDQMGGRGITHCANEEELHDAFEKALRYSENGKIVIEEYIDGEEVNIGYYIDQGTPHLIAVTDNIRKEISGRKNIMIVSCRSRYFKECIDTNGKQMEEFIRVLGARNGFLFFQCIRRDGHYYFLECGYRISGVGLWLLTQATYGFSYVEWMTDLALGQKPSINWNHFDQCFENKHCLMYLYWVKAGKVASVKKIDVQNLMNGVTITMERFKPGDEIVASSDLYQVGWYMQVFADSSEELAEKLRYINDHFQLIDEKGNNLMIPYDDYDHLVKYY